MRSFLNILFLFFSFHSIGQFSATVVTDVDTINVGEILKASIRVNKSASAQFEALDISSVFQPITLQNAISAADSLGNFELPDFEIEKLGKWNNFRDSKIVPYSTMEWVNDPSLNKSYFENEIELRFWDPGVYKLKAGDFIFKDSTQSAIPLEGTLLFVRPPEMNIDTTKQIPIKPIKYIFREQASWKDYWMVLAGIFLFCLLLFFLIRHQRKKKISLDAEIEAPIKEPHVVALEKLNILKAQELWQKGEVKSYQSQLTDIVREYISKRYQVPALEMTTDEITRGLRKRNFDPIYETQLREILTMADMIKFAKAEPPIDIHDQFMATAVNFVQNTQFVPSEEEE